METRNSTSGEKPSVLVISLHATHLPQFFSSLFSPLSAQTQLTYANNPREAIDYLNQRKNRPVAVLIADTAIVERKNSTVLDKVKSYLDNGGTIIFCCLFIGLIRPTDFKRFFHTNFSLPWEMANYSRETVHLNLVATRNLKSIQRLPRSSNQKAVFVKNIEPTDAMYIQIKSYGKDDGITEQPIFDQGAVLWKNVRNGWIGYIGDVNQEEASDQVILAMCGL